MDLEILCLNIVFDGLNENSWIFDAINFVIFGARTQRVILIICYFCHWMVILHLLSHAVYWLKIKKSNFLTVTENSQRFVWTHLILFEFIHRNKVKHYFAWIQSVWFFVEKSLGNEIFTLVNKTKMASRIKFNDSEISYK